MKPTRVKQVLEQLMEGHWPVFLWGPPGVGKSSVVQQVVESHHWELRDVRASLLDPTDLRGIPYVEGGRAFWAPPSFLPSDPDSKGVLFFDELNAAPPLVQASLYQLTLDRRIGEYELPQGWRILAAGNRAEDLAIVFRMPSALANRFTHLDFEPDFEDWREWAIDQHIHPLVVGFLGLRRELLFDAPKEARAFPSPRSWAILSDHLKRLGESSLFDEVAVGTVGEGAAVEFSGFRQNALSEQQVQRILKNPLKEQLPERLGDQYALISHLCSRASEGPVRNAAGLLLGRLPVEMSVLLTRDLLRSFPVFAADPNCMSFLQEHEDLLQ
jgi:hypothetical protein